MGLGTGRCGTQSLVNLLNQLPDTHIDHERFSRHATWLPSMRYFEKICAYFEARDEHNVGDVSFYNLPYVYLFMERYKYIKFVVLQRDKEATLASYDHKTRGRNHFSCPQTAHEHRLWDEKYPKFLNQPKRIAMADYYDLYYGQTAYLERLYPDKVKVFDLDHLNSIEGIRAIFRFLDLNRHSVHHNMIGIRQNVAGETKIDFKPDRPCFFKRMFKKRSH